MMHRRCETCDALMRPYAPDDWVECDSCRDEPRMDAMQEKLENELKAEREPDWAVSRINHERWRCAALESKLAAAEAEIDRLKTEDAAKDDAMLELEGKLATFGDCEDYGTDKHAATRRAIVRAAAAMGVASEDS